MVIGYNAVFVVYICKTNHTVKRHNRGNSILTISKVSLFLCLSLLNSSPTAQLFHTTGGWADLILNFNHQCVCGPAKPYIIGTKSPTKTWISEILALLKHNLIWFIWCFPHGDKKCLHFRSPCGKPLISHIKLYFENVKMEDVFCDG